MESVVPKAQMTQVLSSIHYWTIFVIVTRHYYNYWIFPVNIPLALGIRALRCLMLINNNDLEVDTANPPTKSILSFPGLSLICPPNLLTICHLFLY